MKKNKRRLGLLNTPIKLFATFKRYSKCHPPKWPILCRVGR